VFPFACDEDFDAVAAMTGLGECLLELDRPEESARALRRASRLRVNGHRPNLAFGRLFLKMGDPDRAEQALLLAAELAGEGGDPEIDAALGEACELRQRWEQALEHWSRALTGQPESAAYAERAAASACKLGRPDRAAQLCRRLLSCRPGHVPTLMALSRLCLELGRAEEALGAAEKASLLSPDDAEAADLLAAARACSSLRPAG
jgi:tetratricopeptide (TPR) repeat protein